MVSARLSSTSTNPFFGEFDRGTVSLRLISEPRVHGTGHVREISPAVRSEELDRPGQGNHPGCSRGNDARERGRGDGRIGVGRANHRAMDRVDVLGIKARGLGSRSNDQHCVTEGGHGDDRHEAGAVVIQDELEPGERVVVEGASC